MKMIQNRWRLDPKVLRSLLMAIVIAVLAVMVAGVSTTAIAARRGASPHQSSLEGANPNAIARALPGVYTIPSSCSVPIIPAILTEKEIQLRRYQAEFAKFIEEQARLDQAAALTAQRDVLAIEKFRLDCEIMVLRAQQIYRQNEPQPAPDLAVTAQEVEIRKRQFAIAKQIDAEEITAQEAGVASLNRVWIARRARIDAEILLLQATVQQRLQTPEN